MLIGMFACVGDNPALNPQLLLTDFKEKNQHANYVMASKIFSHVRN